MSMERRLQLGIGLSMAGFTLLFLLLGGYAVRQLIEDYVLSRLEHDAEALLGATRPGMGGGGMGMGMGRGGDTGRHLRPGRITPVYLQPHSGHYYLVKLGAEETQPSRSLWDFELPLPEVTPGERDIRHYPGPAGQQLLQLTLGYVRDGEPIVISVAEDIAEMEAQIRSYQWGFGAAALFLLTLLMLLLHHLVRKGFIPLERMRADVRAVANGERQALDEAVPSEVRPLVEELNRLLGLLESRLSRSRHALGNLAHALKTPLNLMTQELHDGELPEGLRRRLEHRLERIRQLTERELRRARMAGAGSPGQHFSATEEIPDLLQALRSMYRDRGLEFGLSPLPKDPLALDREDMLELLGNLLDNACKWARSRVNLSMQTDPGGGVNIRVSDDGPGVAEADLQRLAERGVRIDEQIDGHGLGLAIVQDITRLYAGRLEFSRDADLGGLAVSLWLPGEPH